MQKEIGSTFWINPNTLQNEYKTFDFSSFGILGTDIVLTSTGRTAILLALTNIEIINPKVKKVALLPTFSCDSVYEPFRKMGYKIIQYPVDDSLQCRDISNEILDDVGVILIHRYFGFNTFQNKDLIDTAKKKGIYIIEDKTQCLFSCFDNLDADYYVASIRKWMGVLDGGILFSRNSKILNKPSCKDEKLEKIKLEAEISKFFYINENKGEKEVFLKKYKEAEELINSQDTIYKMSDISLAILSNEDIDFLKNQRKNNYISLCNRIKDKKILIYPDLPKCVVPLYCPILVSKRDDLQEFLKQNNIYAPIIWPKENDLGLAKCGSLYTNLLSIPIDQRYDENDMIRIANCINEFNKDYR